MADHMAPPTGASGSRPREEPITTIIANTASAAYDDLDVETGGSHPMFAECARPYSNLHVYVPTAEFGPAAFYVHLSLLAAVAVTQTNILSCLCTLAFFYYGTRPPVGK